MARTKGVLSQHGETDSAETKECRNIIATSRNRKGCNIRRTNQSPYNVSRLYPHEGLKGAQGLSQDPRPPATIALGIYRGLGCQQKPRHFCETVNCCSVERIPSSESRRPARNRSKVLGAKGHWEAQGAAQVGGETGKVFSWKHVVGGNLSRVKNCWHQFSLRAHFCMAILVKNVKAGQNH